MKQHCEITGAEMSESKKLREFWIRPARNYSEPIVLPFEAGVLFPDITHVREVSPEMDRAVEALANAVRAELKSSSDDGFGGVISDEFWTNDQLAVRAALEAYDNAVKQGAK